MKSSIFNLGLATVSILILASSCTITHYNGYSKLSADEKSHFRPFNVNHALQPLSYADSFVVERINADDLAELSKVAPNLWVHMIAPWCSGLCEDMGRFQRKADAIGGDVKVVLISYGYQYDLLQQRLKNSGINQMVYVLDTSYSRRTRKSEQQFLASLKRKPWLMDDVIGGEFLMKNDTAVFRRDMRMPDSLFTNALRLLSQNKPVGPQIFPQK